MLAGLRAPRDLAVRANRQHRALRGADDDEALGVERGRAADVRGGRHVPADRARGVDGVDAAGRCVEGAVRPDGRARVDLVAEIETPLHAAARVERDEVLVEAAHVDGAVGAQSRARVDLVACDVAPAERAIGRDGGEGAVEAAHVDGAVRAHHRRGEDTGPRAVNPQTSRLARRSDVRGAAAVARPSHEHRQLGEGRR